MQTSSFTQVVCDCINEIYNGKPLWVGNEAGILNDLHSSVIRFHITRENEVQVKEILMQRNLYRKGKELLLPQNIRQAFKEGSFINHMIDIITTIAKYLIIIMCLIYTLSCYTVFRPKNRDRKEDLLDNPGHLYVCIFILMLHGTVFAGI